MNLDLTGKTALVCGSTQGLGYASAVEIALLGADVILMARDENKLNAAVQTLDTSRKQQHKYLVADFSDPENVKRAITDFVNKGGKAHILVNNTGGPAGGSAIDADPAAFVAAFSSHLVCNHVLVQALLHGMKAAAYGRIINIISTSVKQPLKNLGVSNTVRAAVANWSKTLANELGMFGITVNNVLPGFTKTARADYIIEKKIQESGKSEEEVIQEMVAEIPAKRMGDAADFGAAVAFLCTPSAGYINGINLPIDGGRTACL